MFQQNAPEERDKFSQTCSACGSTTSWAYRAIVTAPNPQIVKMHSKSRQGRAERVEALRFGFATEASMDDASNSKTISSSSNMFSVAAPWMTFRGTLRRLSQQRAMAVT